MADRRCDVAAYLLRCPAGLVYWGKGYKSMAYVTGDHAPSPKPPSHCHFSRFLGVGLGLVADSFSQILME